MFIELVCLALLVGLSASSTTVVIRLLPPFKGWTERGVKPWVCDFCMCFWTVLLYSALVAHGVEDIIYLLIGLPSYAFALYSLRRLTDPAGPPPSVESLQTLLDVSDPTGNNQNEPVSGDK